MVVHYGENNKKAEVGAEQVHLGALAHADFNDGKNPASWVEDEDIWDKAKEAALKSYDLDEEAYWPVVATIYQDMGGGVKSAKAFEKRSLLGLVRAGLRGDFKARKVCAKALGVEWKAVRAAHGETTGKPSFGTLMAKVNQAIQEDPRWDTDSHGHPEGSPGDSEPYCCDILVPDDDGQLSAVICTDEGKLMRHEFTWDGVEVKLADGLSEPTEVTRVYAKEIAHMKAVRAEVVIAPEDGEKDEHGASHLEKAREHAEEAKKFKGTLVGAAHDASAHAHRLSQKAVDSDDDDDHKAAADAHRAAAQKHRDADSHEKAGEHDGHADAHEEEREAEHEDSCTDAREKKIAKSVKAAGTAGGASKGHAARKGDMAFGATKVAHEASAKAHDTDEDDHHDAAADAHEAAQDAHERAAKAYAKTGDDDKYREHTDHAKVHESLAEMHRGDKVDAHEVVHCSTSGVVLAESARWELDTPVDFQWMPGGLSTIHASYNDKPIELTVEVDEAAAKAVQASLEEWYESRPRQDPFGCVEHREEEASVRLPKDVGRFYYRDDPEEEQGVFCTAVPTALGARNVNGRIHRSWSPSFTTDAEYSRATEKDGEMVFPDGVRGSRDNPAHITGVAFSVGTLTNKPAFHNILPVRAKEGERPPDVNADRNKKGQTMKVKFVKARGEYKAGQEAELDANHAAVIDGDAMSVKAADRFLAEEARTLEQRKGTVKAAVQRAKDRQAIPPKDDEVERRAMEQCERLGWNEDAVIIACELVDSKPGKNGNLFVRSTTSAEPRTTGRIERVSASLQEETAGYIQAMEHQDEMCRTNRWDEARAKSMEAAVILKQCHMRLHAKGDDFTFNEAVRGANFKPNSIVRAATFTDPDAQVGSLAGDLVIMRNLGYLVNKLNFLKKVSTDLSGEPAKFGQSILTRYIVPPNVLTWVPGIGFTSDAATIAAAGAGTTQSGATTQSSGTVTKSVPSTPDKSVTLDHFKATEVDFPISKVASTIRNLFAEQIGAQTYSLAEEIAKFFLSTVFAATWTPVTAATLAEPLVNFNISQLVKIKNFLTLNKIPDVGRFIMLHSSWHDKLLEDSNLILANTILAALNKDDAAFHSGELPRMFNMDVLESQLAAFTGSTYTGITDPTNIGTVNRIGFAGNMASMLFVSRPPQDWTTTLTQLGIPLTASIRLVTEPDAGLTVMVFSYADNGKMEINQRVTLMYGAAQGHPGMAFLLTPS